MKMAKAKTKAKAKKEKAAKPAGVLNTGRVPNEDIPAKILTPAFTASYVRLLEPAADLSGNMKYSVSMIFDKDKTDLDIINAAIKAAAEAKFGKKLPKNFKNPLRDGDEERDGEEYENSWFINCSTTRRPQITDLENDNELVTSDDDELGIYSGCVCRASVTFFGFDKSGNKGVGCGLNNVQLLKRGERIDGGTSAEADFSDDEDDLDLDDL
jgi:hypothetical protein